MWSMLAVAKESKVNLDELLYINEAQEIISVPLQKSNTKKTAGKDKKPDDEKVEDNAKATEDTPTTE